MSPSSLASKDHIGDRLNEVRAKLNNTPFPADSPVPPRESTWLWQKLGVQRSECLHRTAGPGRAPLGQGAEVPESLMTSSPLSGFDQRIRLEVGLSSSGSGHG